MAYVPPVGQTTDPDIFLENVKRADRLVSGPAETVPDRGGEPLDTWRQMMAKNDSAIEDARKNITILGLPFTTREEAQAAADEGKIPVGAVTWVRSIEDTEVADELINNGGTLEATGRQLPAKGSVDSLNDTRTEMTLSLSGENVDKREQQAEVVIVADKGLRKLVKLDNSKQRIVVFGNETPYKSEVDEARTAGSETWQYNGTDTDKIILLADNAGRVIRYLKISEKTEYLFGKKVGSDGAGYTPPKSWTELVDLRDYGQSLSNSYVSGVGITTTLVRAFMFNTGITTYGVATPANLQTIPDTTQQQYHDTSLIHQLEANNPSSDRKYFAAASGLNGAAIELLMPGTTVCNQLIASIDRAATLAAEAGYQYGLPAMTYFQGEGDAYAGTPVDTYITKSKALHSYINSHVKSVSRVDSDMPFIIYQMASHGRYEGLSNNPSTNIPVAQLELAASDPMFQLCTPMYIFPYADGVHLTNHGYRWLGLFREKAISHWMRTGTPWKPLYPTDVYKVGDKTVVAVFHVPKSPLQFRTDIVPEHPAGSKGFELWQEMGNSSVLERIAIESVQLLDDDKVKVVSATPFTDKIYLAYGWTPLNRGASDGAGRYPSWNAGVNSGVCGNLCDSDDATTDLLNVAGNPYPLQNYSCLFLSEAK